MDKMQTRLTEIRANIDRAAGRSGRRGRDITLIAVSKMVEPEITRQAYQLGITDFGENRVQEMNRKKAFLPEARWHFIGRLQTNKVKDVVGEAYMIHSLDRWGLAEAINKRALSLGIRVPVLVQVNISGADRKTGLVPAELEEFLRSMGQLAALQVRGLMTMAEEEPDPEASRPVFRELSLLRARLAELELPNVELHHLSMGMSQDYQVAIEEGADMVRIGSALFS